MGKSNKTGAAYDYVYLQYLNQANPTKQSELSTPI
jgi:hypothetical protein